MKTTNCIRCGRLCQSAKSTSDARVYRRAEKGTCPDCTAVILLKGLDHEHGGKLFENGPECLRLPHIQGQFAALMKVGMADASPSEINWDRVIELWDAVQDKPKGLF
jgi:hypothetical protein